MIFVTSMRKSVLSVLIIRAIRSYKNPPFHRAFSPIHSKWTKWTRKWAKWTTPSFLLFTYLCIAKCNSTKNPRPSVTRIIRFSSVVLSPPRYESVPADRAAKNNGSQWNKFQKKCLSLQARVTLCDFPCGRLTSFDPSENLENSMYMGEKFEGCSTCNAYA